MVPRFAFCVVVLISCLTSQSTADDVFETPVRLEADGKVIDTGRMSGHSGPTMADVDGDGLADLVVGSFGGKFQVYKNIGAPGKPLYSYIGLLQAGGTDAQVRIYCCVGSQARFVDLNGDGLQDFVSNSYDPGHCYFCRGMADHQFATPEELVDKTGVPVRCMPVQQQEFQSFGSFYTPVDWDADGDFDLLIGTFEGYLKLRRNEGDARKPVFAADNETIEAGGEPLKVQAHCSPVVADWDGDGARDILSAPKMAASPGSATREQSSHPGLTKASRLSPRMPPCGAASAWCGTARTTSRQASVRRLKSSTTTATASSTCSWATCLRLWK